MSGGEALAVEPGGPSASEVRSPRRNLLKVVAFGSGARLFALGSQFVVILMLSRILDKHQFGEMMIAFAAYRIFSFALGTGLGNLVLIHVARSGGDPKVDIPLHRTVLLTGLATSTLITITIVALSGAISSAFDKPDMAAWLDHMAPMAIFGTLNLIAVGSLDGRWLITRSIVLNELAPNILRLLGLGLIWVFALPPILVAHVLWISLALPWIAECAYLTSRRISGFARLKGWDIRYSLHFIVQSAGSMQLQGFDLLIVGYLYSSSDAGNYALASRIAVFFPFFSNIMSKNFAPLAASYIHQDKIGLLQKELNILRNISVCVNSINIIICFILTMVLTRWFLSDYQDIVKLVLALSITMVIRSFYFGVDRILQAGDLAGKSALVQYISLFNLVATSVVLAPWLGVFSVPAAMIVSSSLLNPLSEHFVRRKFDLKIFQTADIAPALLVCISSVLVILWFPPLAATLGVSLILMALLAFMLVRRVSIRSLLKGIS